MKKFTIITLCLLTLGSTIFAYDLSVGFGAVYGIVNDTWDFTDNTYIDFNRNQYGAFAFFGTRYTEFNFSVRLSNNDYENRVRDDITLMLNVGAYGKIPIPLGTMFVFFPTIGVDFDAVEDFTYLWFRGGVGLDVFFTERFFLRAQGLYGIGIEPFFLLSNAINLNYNNGYEKVTPGHGPFAKLGIGWMF
jgi:hypothetical protein